MEWGIGEEDSQSNDVVKPAWSGLRSKSHVMKLKIVQDSEDDFKFLDKS